VKVNQIEQDVFKETMVRRHMNDRSVEGGGLITQDRQKSAGLRSLVDHRITEGLAAQHAGRWDVARQHFDTVLESDCDQPVALYSIAAIESNRGRPEAGLPFANRLLELRPDFVEGLIARAMILEQLGRADIARTDLERARTLAPQNAAVRQQLERLETASARQRKPAGRPEVEALCVQGLSAQHAGDAARAASCFERALAIDERHFASLYSLALVLSQQGSTERAFALMTRASETEPDNPMAHFALGTMLQGQGLAEAALAAFDRAIALNPGYIEASNNKATLLHDLGRQKDALLTIDAALARAPDDTKLLGNKGYLLSEFKLHAEAAATFRRVLDLNPDHEYAEGLHVYARLHACDWTDYESNCQRIVEGVRAGRKVCNPLAFMAISDDAHDARRCAETFAAHRFPASPAPLWEGEVYRHRKIRVAFISADFREHPVGYLLIGLIEALDRKRFETVGISLGIRDGSELYRRYRNGFDHYFDCANKTSQEVAQLMRAMEIDIAIDLSGYTAGSRLDVLARRPAPVQMTYLGFPGGLGAEYIDCLIADRVTIPHSLESAYRERILRLPDCYLPRDHSVRPAPAPLPRESLGLPKGAPVFCSFNHDYKINPTMFACWMELLREVPDSILWLMKLNENAERNLQRTAASLDIDPARLLFATRVPRIEDHLARYAYADVFLDTFPYNGHTTASDAIYAGVPVVTLTGSSFASRVAASLLAHSDRPGFAATDLQRYRQAALSFIERGREQRSQRGQWHTRPADQAQGFATMLADAHSNMTLNRKG
jgi:predicted O-linked N-acetylglucosamine transferase (SPINDLY family)